VSFEPALFLRLNCEVEQNICHGEKYPFQLKKLAVKVKNFFAVVFGFAVCKGSFASILECSYA